MCLCTLSVTCLRISYTTCEQISHVMSYVWRIDCNNQTIHQHDVLWHLCMLPCNFWWSLFLKCCIERRFMHTCEGKLCKRDILCKDKGLQQQALQNWNVQHTLKCWRVGDGMTRTVGTWAERAPCQRNWNMTLMYAPNSPNSCKNELCGRRLLIFWTWT